jgi:hypothetical protein
MKEQGSGRAGRQAARPPGEGPSAWQKMWRLQFDEFFPVNMEKSHALSFVGVAVGQIVKIEEYAPLLAAAPPTQGGSPGLPAENPPELCKSRQ